MSNNSKTYKVGQFILDSVVPEINMPIMKPSRKKTFNMEEWINKTIAKISNKIKQKSMQIANWILNTKIEENQIPAKSLPAKIKDLVNLVRKTKYSDVEMSHNYEKRKLSVKKLPLSKIMRLFIK